MFVDEAHFIKLAALQNGPFAFLGQNAVLICASTPPKGISAMDDVIAAQLDGNPVCKTVDFDFNCPACKEEQITNPDKFCEHNMHFRSHIFNPHALAVARACFGDHVDAFNREMMGSGLGTGGTFMNTENMQLMRDVRHVDTKPPRFLWFSIDPSGSSSATSTSAANNSYYAMVAGYYEAQAFGHMATPLFVITGLEACKFHSSDKILEINNAFTRFVLYHRVKPLFESSTFLIVPERNLGFAADHIKALVAGDPVTFNNCHVLSESANDVGFLTGSGKNHVNKYVADKNLQELVSLNALRLSRDLVCMHYTAETSSAGITAHGNRVDEKARRAYEKKCVDMLFEQFGNMKEYEQIVGGVTIKKRISGITDADGNRIVGRNDDLERCLAFLLFILYAWLNNHPMFNNKESIMRLQEQRDMKIVERLRTMIKTNTLDRQVSLTNNVLRPGDVYVAAGAAGPSRTAAGGGGGADGGDARLKRSADAAGIPLAFLAKMPKNT